MKITIYDIAKKAGVGIATVSRALNDSPKIHPDTKDKVLKIVNELNYRPHGLAKGLASRKTYTISVIVPVLASHFFFNVISGIQKEALKNNYDLILYSVEKSERVSFYLDKILNERKVDCVVVVSLNISDRFANKFKNSGFPVILVDSYNPLMDSIFVENTKGAFNATEHLIKLGHEKIGLINGIISSRPARQRYEGFVKALVSNSIKLDERLVIECNFLEDNDGFTENAGYLAMNRLLDLGKDRPSAVFVSSDIQAIGAIKALNERKIRVPEEISLVGFDDIELSVHLGLTTIKQPMYEMGSLAVKRLLNEELKTQDGVLSKEFATELIIRESTCKFKHT